MHNSRFRGAAFYCSMLLLAVPTISLAQKVVDPLFPPDKAGLELVSAKGRWPKFEQGQKRRVHVWYDDNAIWHFRCTCSAAESSVFVGGVVIDKGRIQIVGGDGEAQKKKVQGSDLVQLTSNGMTFRFKTSGKLDGLDFIVPKEAKRIRFEFVVDNDPRAEYIFIGATGGHPSKSSFTLPAHPDKQ